MGEARTAEDERGGLRTDSERLDWMEKAKPHVGYLWGGTEVFQAVVGRQGQQATGASIREAIDKAIDLDDEG